ncbi:MAG: hypothetical protein NT007_04970 [Candidatus Kapabacteria bacterium]|nr:hypothetical protein [Candidatus Kapabacteria bacterium]
MKKFLQIISTIACVVSLLSCNKSDSSPNSASDEIIPDNSKGIISLQAAPSISSISPTSAEIGDGTCFLVPPFSKGVRGFLQSLQSLLQSYNISLQFY